jgi:hypothetical protein
MVMHRGVLEEEIRRGSILFVVTPFLEVILVSELFKLSND